MCDIYSDSVVVVYDEYKLIRIPVSELRWIPELFIHYVCMHYMHV